MSDTASTPVWIFNLGPSVQNIAIRVGDGFRSVEIKPGTQRQINTHPDVDRVLSGAVTASDALQGAMPTAGLLYAVDGPINVQAVHVAYAQTTGTNFQRLGADISAASTRLGPSCMESAA